MKTLIIAGLIIFCGLSLASQSVKLGNRHQISLSGGRVVTISFTNEVASFGEHISALKEAYKILERIAYDQHKMNFSRGATNR
jgi:hypothetical protein